MILDIFQRKTPNQELPNKDYFLTEQQTIYLFKDFEVTAYESQREFEGGHKELGQIALTLSSHTNINFNRGKRLEDIQYKDFIKPSSPFNHADYEKVTNYVNLVWVNSYLGCGLPNFYHRQKLQKFELSLPTIQNNVLALVGFEERSLKTIIKRFGYDDEPFNVNGNKITLKHAFTTDLHGSKYLDIIYNFNMDQHQKYLEYAIKYKQKTILVANTLDINDLDPNEVLIIKN